jgi:type VI secretion system secreted protein Hcp
MIEGCKGTSTVKKDAIEIHSFSWGVSNASASAKASGESRAGRPDLSELHIQKNVDPTSHDLMKHCMICMAFPSATLGFMKQISDTNQEYFQLVLTQVYISSMQVSSGGDNPMESVSIAYEKIEFKYNPEKADKKGLEGWKFAKWNVKENKPE